MDYTGGKCRYVLNIRTGKVCNEEGRSKPIQTVALDVGLNVLIISGYVEFSAG